LRAASLDAYEQTAVALARDPRKLTALRETLRQNRDATSLFDLPRSTAHIEAAYRRMWDTWCAGRVPEAFAIEDV
jgi:protein O-GlcNAc transferase